MSFMGYRLSNHVAGVAMIMTTCMGSATVSHAGELSGSEWRPIVIGSVDVPENADIFVRFEAEGALKGNGGCNSFFGSYQISGSGLEIGPLGATSMACPEAVMERETNFMSALQAGKSFKRDRNGLSLFSENGAIVMTLTQRDAD